MSQSTGTRKWRVQVSAGDSLCLAMPEVGPGRTGRTTPGGGEKEVLMLLILWCW